MIRSLQIEQMERETVTIFGQNLGFVVPSVKMLVATLKVEDCIHTCDKPCPAKF